MLEHYRNFSLHFNFIKNKKLMELYFVLAFTALGYSIMGLFVPIYLLADVGLPLSNVLYFLIMCAVANLVFFPLAIKLSSWIGMNKTLFISVPMKIIYLILLNSLKTYDIPLIIIAIIASFSTSTFWLPYHKRFAEASDHDHRGSEIGVRFALTGLFAILGPILGGFIATYFGFTWLYIIAGILFTVSALPIFLIKEEYAKKDFKLLDILRGRTYKELLSYFAEGLRFHATILWTIFIFLALNSYIALGGIFSGAALLNAVLQVFIGYISDKFSYKTLLRGGTIVDSLTWFIRPLFTSLYSIFSITALGGLAVTMWYVPFSSKIYDKFSKQDGSNHIVFREWGLVLGRIAILLIALIFSLKWSIISTGVFNFLVWLL